MLDVFTPVTYYDFLKQNINTNLKPGIGRFESILGKLGLGGEVPDRIRRIMFELSEKRNVLIHCNGKADSRIIKRCLWLNLSVGDEVRISRKDFGRYIQSAHWYLLELIVRLNRPTISDDPQDIDSLQKHEELRDFILSSLESGS
ncbi:MAG: hypothetical protein EXS64_06420 [Candidatus Latescibacteria bacterium]|nr:hypothetical protein [Candidatus Latescibacterota bacterium]